MRTVVFDLGGVVCRYRPERRLRALARLYGREPADVHRILYGSGFAGATELGEWSAAEIVAEIGARLGRTVGRAELEAAWLASFPVDEEVLDLVARVAVRHRTALFTNNDLLLREALRPELGDLFGEVVFSAEIRAVKPAAEAFQRALSIMEADPADVVFIDDSDVNVAAAVRAGIAAVRFRDAEQLAAELGRSGLIDG